MRGTAHRDAELAAAANAAASYTNEVAILSAYSAAADRSGPQTGSSVLLTASGTIQASDLTHVTEC